MKFLIQFAHYHLDFCLPELLSVSKLKDVKIDFNEKDYSKNSPFLIVEIDDHESAKKIADRSILIKSIYELWAVGSNYDQVITNLAHAPELKLPYMESSFRFIVQGFGNSLLWDHQLKVINKFSFLDFQGPVDLKNPEVTFVVIEDFGHREHGYPPTNPIRIFMGPLVANGHRSVAIDKYNLKKRSYLGSTSMDAELSLIMANQALAKKGSLVYDPFVGTGSLLVTCAHFGAYPLGSDIDGRQIRGKDGNSVKTNLSQYQVHGKVLDNLVFDIAHHPWREQPLFDCIVTDPPYGVRAGAKRIGMKSKKAATSIPFVSQVKENVRYPSTIPYEMSDVLKDLLDFSAKFLLKGGRLVYWLPTIVEEYDSTDVPLHPSMILVSNSEQNFGKWSRRLITMEKVLDYISCHRKSEDSKDKITSKLQELDIQKPEFGHSHFREKYFELKKNDAENTSQQSSQVEQDPQISGSEPVDAKLVERAIAELEEIIGDPLIYE